MKIKFIAIVAAAACCMFTANAQENKAGKDIFIGASAGVITPTTADEHHNLRLNMPGFYASLEFGRYFTPVWGSRLVLGAGNQRYDIQNQSVDILHTGTMPAVSDDLWNNGNKPVTFGEINMDVLFNLSQAISKKSLPLVDFYIFAGPTVNFASRTTKFVKDGELTFDGHYIVEQAANNDIKARFGATAGLGIMFNINKYYALGLEGRSAVSPSVFGDVSRCRKAENTNRLAIRFAYTFGGRLGKDGYKKGEKVVEVPVEKVVEKEVVKEVVKEVEKVVEVVNPVANSVFFKIGKAVIDDQDKVRLDMFAESIKAAGKNHIYKVSGYADKGTGSAKFNQEISEKRAKAVYDYLVGKGVDPSQLEIVANGGVDNMFFDKASLSRVVIVAK